MSFSCFIAFYSLHWPGGKAVAPQISTNRGMFCGKRSCRFKTIVVKCLHTKCTQRTEHETLPAGSRFLEMLWNSYRLAAVFLASFGAERGFIRPPAIRG
jgi:hypothetical protein